MIRPQKRARGLEESFAYRIGSFDILNYAWYRTFDVLKYRAFNISYRMHLALFVMNLSCGTFHGL